MDSREDVQDAMAYLSARLDTEALELLTWEDLMPVLISFMETSDAMTYGYFIFIFIAVAFGIVNTLLMAVFERTREFGMLQALGLRPKRVFGLIIVESAWLGVVGVLIGCAISILVIQGAFGGEMDLSSVSESLAVMGMSSRVPMPFTWDIVVGPGIAVLIMAALSAIIPARKAAKLHPAEAVAFV
jgi:ABC-type antimicrobial peptide transport system permease subunit